MPVPDRFHGLLIVDKPAGWTSHQVVGRMRRMLGQRSIGHAGTLDPAATGVLPLAIGSATRAIEYLSGAGKTYLADVTFGVATDTLDADGRVVGRGDRVDLDEDELQSVLEEFLGELNQVPPAYSAIKVAGQPLYKRARSGEVVVPESRSVNVLEISLVSWSDQILTMCVDCSKGFYVRSLARDLGVRFGTVAYLSNLVRLRVGPFDLTDAWTLADLENAPIEHEWERIAVAPDDAAWRLPAVVLSDVSTTRWSHGVSIPIDTAGSEGAVRVYDSAGQWLGIGTIRIDADVPRLDPRKVIHV